MADEHEFPAHGEITGTLSGLPDPNTPVWGPITGTIKIEGLIEQVSEEIGLTTGSATAPDHPEPGDLWTTIDGKLYIWRGSFWVQVI